TYLTAHYSSYTFPLRLHHRHLHSFPTRRSSDLTLHPRLVLSDEEQEADDADDAENGGGGLTAQEAEQLRELMRDTVIYGTLSSIDRKSTRLNSSHVSISYAVFCLKKKKHNK